MSGEGGEICSRCGIESYRFDPDFEYTATDLEVAKWVSPLYGYTSSSQRFTRTLKTASLDYKKMKEYCEYYAKQAQIKKAKMNVLNELKIEKMKREADKDSGDIDSREKYREEKERLKQEAKKTREESFSKESKFDSVVSSVRSSRASSRSSSHHPSPHNQKSSSSRPSAAAAAASSRLVDDEAVESDREERRCITIHTLLHTNSDSN